MPECFLGVLCASAVNRNLTHLHQVSSIKRASPNTVQLGKTGTDANFLPLEIGCLSQRFAALTEQYWN
jgi:hypothetical protein